MHVKFDITLTDLLAVWGAFIATLVLIWDIFKWKRSGPQIVFEALPNMMVLGVPTLSKDKTYIIAKATNKGDRTTTITNLGVRYYSNRFCKLLQRPKWQGVIANTGLKPLPYILKPGETWSGLIDQDEFNDELYERGILIVELYCSHSKKPKKVRVRPQKPKEKEEHSEQ